MALFLDTSALVKLFDPEPGSEVVAELVRAGGRVTVGALAPHEFVSAIRRKTREGRLPAAQSDRLREQFRSSFLPGADVVALDAVVSDRALALLDRHADKGLRVLDAVQLACCLAVPGSTFVSGDHDLARAAEAEGVSTKVVG
ncbi:MAG: type II toxin-antitoxin system VapC family toxin [bacterium]